MLFGDNGTGLLAQQSRIADLGRNFRGPEAALTSRDLLILACIALAVTAMVLLLKRLSRGGQKRRTNSPRKLFRELCRLHGLEHGNRQLLMRLARFQQLEHPGRLFVDEGCFDAANLGPLAGDEKRLAAIRRRLFGETRQSTP